MKSDALLSTSVQGSDEVANDTPLMDTGLDRANIAAWLLLQEVKHGVMGMFQNVQLFLVPSCTHHILE